MLAARVIPPVLRRVARAAWVALYAAVALIVPLSHATTEVASSVVVLESTHSDDCDMVHGGAACRLVATLQVAHPSPAARGDAARTDTADIPTPHHVDPIRIAESVPPPARAPPSR